MKKLSLYIHIPFCTHKCAYCNFVSFANANDKKESYIKALCNEINMQGKSFGKFYDIISIYIGGGSPSCLKEGQIGKIMSELKNSFRIMPNAEISIEVNPETVTEKKLLEYKLVGINRLSIGGQTMNQKILNQIGRKHTVENTKNAVKLAKNIGFENINVDMMLGLPLQKMSDVKKMTKFLISKKIQHISPYSLILEPSTPLYNLVLNKKVTLPTEDETVEMYNYVFKFLTKKGFSRYEVSNFSLPDYESVHNLNYWNMGEYLAFGVSGHSFINNTRIANTENLDDYINEISKNNIPVVSREKISLSMRKDETLMLALRTREGLNLRDFDNKFSCHLMKDKKKEIDFLTRNHFISVRNDYLRVNDNAFYVLNSIIGKLV